MDALIDEDFNSTEKVVLSHAFLNSVYIKMVEFMRDPFSEILEFPSCLNSSERQFIRKKAQELNIYCKSRFVGAQRFITVYKKQPTVIRKDSHLPLTPKIQKTIQDLLKNLPVTKKEREIFDQRGPSTFPKYDNLIGTPKVPNTIASSILTDFKRRLPVHKHLNEISKVIYSNQVTLILGDPGSGKTSQIPQFIMDEYKKLGKACYMVCTQPSRLAAASIAQRVAFERKEDVGNSIGYESKLERVCNDKTLLTFCPAEVLLRVLTKGNNALQNITHVFVDEVHHRDKILDVLLIALKDNLKQYPCLRLVLMGAEIDVTDYTRFFEDLAVYHIENIWFNVERYFLEDVHFLLSAKHGNTVQNDQVIVGNMVNYNLILNLVKFLHETMPKGSILIFVPGFDDIFNLGTAICKCSELDPSSYKVLTLFNDVQSIDHKEIYSEEHGIRKIVISTEFAETSITVYDVVYVIDVGVVRTSVFSPIADSVSKLLHISKVRMEHRMVRAGRTQPGKYFMLQNKNVLDVMCKNCVPQICVTPITDICLIAKCLAPNISVYKYLDKAIIPPQVSTVQSTVATLTDIEAIDTNESLTDLGQILLNLSIEPRLGKMIFYSILFKCLDPVLTIACCLSSNEVFRGGCHPSSKIDAVYCKKNFAAKSFSDHMAILRAFQLWAKKKTDQYVDSSYNSHVINEAAMESIVNIRIKLVAELRAIDLIKPRSPGDMRDLNVNSEKWYVIKAALFFGIYPNIAKIDRDEHLFLHSSTEPCLNIHPQSVLSSNDGDISKSLAKLPTEWIMFGGMIDIGMFRHIECCTVVTLLTIVLFGGPLRISTRAIQTSNNDSDSEDGGPYRTIKRACLTVDNWIDVFFDNSEDAHNLFELRQKFSALVVKKLRNPSTNLQAADERVIETIINLLGEEETNARITCPPRIGQRPHKSLTVHNRTMFEPLRKSHTTNIVNNCVIQDQKINSSELVETNESSCTILSKILSISYLLIKSQSFEIIEQSMKTGIWTLVSNVRQQLIQVASTGNRLLLFFCVERPAVTFYGCAQFVSYVPDNGNMIRVKWVSNIKVKNDGSNQFLKFICDKYWSSWCSELTELPSQCGQYFERLLNNSEMNSMGRPIQKKM